MIEHNSEVYNPPPTVIFFHIYMYNEKRYVGGIVSLLCSIFPLVSLLFAVLVSLHPATFLMFFITSLVYGTFLAAGACLS